MKSNSISSTSSMNLQSPEMSKASQVQMKIESKIGKVSDLFADIQAIMAELAALEPPTHPGEKATDQEKAASCRQLMGISFPWVGSLIQAPAVQTNSMLSSTLLVLIPVIGNGVSIAHLSHSMTGRGK